MRNLYYKIKLKLLFKTMLYVANKTGGQVIFENGKFSLYK